MCAQKKLYTRGMVDKAASDLAKKRWKKATPEERKEVGRMLNEAKYSGMTNEERKAIGKRLTLARKKAKKRKK